MLWVAFRTVVFISQDFQNTGTIRGKGCVSWLPTALKWGWSSFWRSALLNDFYVFNFRLDFTKLLEALFLFVIYCHLWTDCLENMGPSTSCGPPRPVTWIALLIFNFLECGRTIPTITEAVTGLSYRPERVTVKPKLILHKNCLNVYKKLNSPRWFATK
jgi:hypothetical protein